MRVLFAVVVAVLLWPTWASAQSDEHHEWWLHGAIFGSGVGAATDLSATSWARGKNDKKFIEGNWFLRPFANDPVALAVTKASIDGAVIWLSIKHHGKHPKVVLAVALAKTAISAWAAHSNAKLAGLR